MADGWLWRGLGNPGFKRHDVVLPVCYARPSNARANMKAEIPRMTAQTTTGKVESVVLRDDRPFTVRSRNILPLANAKPIDSTAKIRISTITATERKETDASDDGCLVACPFPYRSWRGPGSEFSDPVLCAWVVSSIAQQPQPQQRRDPDRLSHRLRRWRLLLCRPV
jgi:hypothetical protein